MAMERARQRNSSRRSQGRRNTSRRASRGQGTRRVPSPTPTQRRSATQIAMDRARRNRN